jgi:CheY-like chemotaxis protein
MKILIVDDVAANRKLLRVTLQAEGYQTQEAEDGVEALKILAQSPVDAVVSDILMPNMDGYRLCQEIRQDAKLRQLPFIIYTSTFDSPGDRNLAKSVGADKYLTKPARIGDVLEAIQETIRLSGTARAQTRCRPEEVQVMKEYNAVLVNKLEEKNKELQESFAALQRANDDIVKLNAGLEQRVRERTDQLAAANRELHDAVSIFKELCICSCCKRIRDDRNRWRQLEDYINGRIQAKVQQTVCPDCDTHREQPALGTAAAIAESR